MRRLLLPLTALLVIVLAAAAGASIRINIGIDGVKIGQTQAQVRANLGKPSKIIHGANQVSTFTEFRYTALKMVVTFQGDTSVTSMTTRGLGDRTATGVGVGSTEARVKAGVKNVKCEAVSAGRRICFIPVGDSGRGTTFRLTNGKVTEISVAILAD
jgi:hypothetical protein